jgi:hypothetical protein
MMGLSRTALWTSYFIHYFCMFLVSAWDSTHSKVIFLNNLRRLRVKTLSLFSVTIATIILCSPISKNGAIISYTNWSIVYVLLILYGISLINMGFMISTWFSYGIANQKKTFYLQRT